MQKVKVIWRNNTKRNEFLMTFCRNERQGKVDKAFMFQINLIRLVCSDESNMLQSCSSFLFVCVFCAKRTQVTRRGTQFDTREYNFCCVLFIYPSTLALHIVLEWMNNLLFQVENGAQNSKWTIFKITMSAEKQLFLLRQIIRALIRVRVFAEGKSRESLVWVWEEWVEDLLPSKLMKGD